jgi:cell division protein ZapA
VAWWSSAEEGEIMESVQVEIFGQLYSIKGMEDHDYIRELAAFVDAKMKEVQKGTGTANPHRVAILTALTISDEFYRLRKQHSSFEQMVDGTVLRLLELTDDPGLSARA